MCERDMNKTCNNTSRRIVVDQNPQTEITNIVAGSCNIVVDYGTFLNVLRYFLENQTNNVFVFGFLGSPVCSCRKCSPTILGGIFYF